MADPKIIVWIKTRARVTTPLRNSLVFRHRLIDFIKLHQQLREPRDVNYCFVEPKILAYRECYLVFVYYARCVYHDDARA